MRLKCKVCKTKLTRLVDDEKLKRAVEGIDQVYTGSFVCRNCYPEKNWVGGCWLKMTDHITALQNLVEDVLSSQLINKLEWETKKFKYVIIKRGVDEKMTKCKKIMFRDIETSIQPRVIFAKILSEDEQFISFLSGRGISYRVNKLHIICIEDTDREFQLQEGC